MPARAFGPNRTNLDQKTIMFCMKPSNYGKPYIKKRIKESSPQKLFLLSEFSEFSIFDVIPKNFSITTKNGISHFNLDMLKETSPVITSFIRDNPTKFEYNLNINDEENVLGKIESLFQGKTVTFIEDEFPTSQRITKILQMKYFPNKLKPDSMRSNEICSDGSHYFSIGNSVSQIIVEIYEDMFIEYLKKPELQTFIIKTKRNEYKCSIFGIYSSNVIREILEKNSSINEFEFDFDDEFDEFQSICDFFNFKQVDIKSDNMDLLKEIAEKMQINCIIKQIDNYINYYENLSQKIDEQQTIIDSIDNLFNLLCNIKMHGIQKVNVSIVQSIWSKKEESVQELAAFILQIAKNNLSLHNEMADLLIMLNNEANESNELDKLLPFVIDKLINLCMSESSFVKNEPPSFKVSNNSIINYYLEKNKGHYILFFIRNLYKRGIISKDKINKNLKNNNFLDEDIYSVFLPELIEMNPKNLDKIAQLTAPFNRYLSYPQVLFAQFIDKYLPDKIDIYERMLDKTEPNDELTKSLLIDDVDTLQSIITSNEIDVSTAFVPFNIFDRLDKNPSFLNYAALCGSLKCFKYLLLNNGTIDGYTLYFAVCGGNIEIIKIVDQRSQDLTEIPDDKNNQFSFSSKKMTEDDKIKTYETKNGIRWSILNYNNENNVIASTIAMHRNELFDWIFENKFVNKGKIGNSLKFIASLSAMNGNAHSLIEIVDKGFEVSFDHVYHAAKNGFCKLTELLLSIIEQKDKKNYANSKKTFDFKSTVYFGNLSLFKLFIKHMNQQDFEIAISYAIELKYKKIVDYFFDNIESIQFEITEIFVKNALKASLVSETDEYFNNLIEKFKLLNPSLINLNLFTYLLKYACLYSNFQAVKTITDIILKENPQNDFSSAFLNASSSSSMDICRFFIEKKVRINYDDFSTQISGLGSIDVELFSMIINNVNPNNKHRFLKTIDQAIFSKNKKLIEFLLNENAPIQNALFEAVSTNDIEIVDLILKYNSKPSFVNSKNPEGTALHIAVRNQNLAITKRLLSIPGINAGLFNSEYISPLRSAVMNCNLEIINAILDFYGKNALSQVFSILSNFDELFNDLNDEKNWKIIKRLLQVESVDPNFYYGNSTILIKACYKGNINVVNDLLQIENIDVNQYEIDSYNTPLMIAIKKRHIKLCELLIEYPKTDLNIKNISDKSALHLAITSNLNEIVQLILNDERFNPIESGINYAFYHANADIAKILFNSNSLDINYIHEKEIHNYKSTKIIEKTPLIHSVQINDVDKIDLIINHPTFDKEKSNINKAIFTAAKANNIEIFKLLLKLIDNDISIRSQKSLLEIAAKNLSGEIIDEIFNNEKFDPKSNDILKAFICSFAKFTKKLKLIRNNNIPRGNPIHHQNQLQIMHGDLIPHKSTVIEIMNKIYDYDNNHEHLIDFTKLLENGKSFFTSIFRDYEDVGEVSDFLIQHGVDPNIPDKKGIFPLEHAINLNSTAFINSLLNSNKINLEQLDDGNSYLHKSIQCSNENTFKFILDKNIIDINSTNNNGETPLFVACQLNKTKIIDLLFEKNDLDYLHCDKNGIDALNSIELLPLEEDKKAKQNKESYHAKIISIINSKLSSESNK